MQYIEYIEILLGILLVPSLFLGLYSIFAWRYRRAVAEGMSRRSVSLPLQPGGRDTFGNKSTEKRRPLRLRRIDPLKVEASGPARSALATASRTTADLWLAFVAGGGAHMMLTVCTLYWSNLTPVAWPMTAFLALAPGLVVLGHFAAPNPRALGIGAAAYISAGCMLIALSSDPVVAVRAVSAFAPLLAGIPLAGVTLLLARRLRPLLVALVALVIYFIVGIAVILALDLDFRPAQTEHPWMPWLGVAYQVIGMAILFVLLRQPNRWVVVVLAALAMVGLIVDRLLQPAFPIGPILVGLPFNVLQFYIVWLVFKLFIHMKEQRLLADQVLHSHFCWLFLTIFFGMFVGAVPGGLQQPVLAYAPFIAYVVVLHLALLRIRRAPRGEGKSLLLLRVFNHPEKRGRLLEMLDTWRRIGRIDLVAGTDIALQTLGARMLEAFMLLSIDRQFLKSEENVDRRVDQLSSRLEADGRYVINELYCYADVWQRAIVRLAPAADIVLMDLRGFGPQNKGCVFELSTLISSVPLKRILLVTDLTTDNAALEKIVHDAWRNLPSASPNSQDLAPELMVLVFCGREREDRHALTACVFSMAFGGPQKFEPRAIAPTLPKTLVKSGQA